MGKQLKVQSILIFFSVLLFGCGLIETGESIISAPIQTLEISPTEDFSNLGLSNAEIATLSTLQKVDDYPLFTMEYFGEYKSSRLLFQYPIPGKQSPAFPWGCSLFAALADPNNLLFGRNFDWEFSPALILFTDPPDGYASVSMVDIAYLGFDEKEAKNLDSLSLSKLTALMYAPELPFDGVNEKGLAIGMAAVPPGDVSDDPGKNTIGSIAIIRIVLDQASNVSDAISIMEQYNINFEGGPHIHYLIADKEGNAVIVEYAQGEMQVIPNMNPWHLATNFLVSSVGDRSSGICARYDRMKGSLEGFGGNLRQQGAMDLLKDVSQETTQWSIVYNLSTGEVQVVMGQAYDEEDRFRLEMVD